MTITRDCNGRPFSKWKPAEKFRYTMHQAYPVIWGQAVPEYPFHDDRKWRLDFAWPEQKIAVEIDGFGYGHQAQQNIAKQNEKRNAAILAGWRVLVFDSRLLGSRDKVRDAADVVAMALCGVEV